MQVEYESSPAAPGSGTGFEEGLSFRPGLGNGNGEGEGGETSEEEEEGVETEQAQQATNTTTAKPKRIIKQRQSLAEKQPGTTIFPLSRIKRIVKADKDLDTMSSEAVFMVAVATEYFIKHFMEEGYTKARLEKRKIVNYKDMAAVVARSEEFDFLKDVIPAPMLMSEALELRKHKLAADENPSLHEDVDPQPGTSHMNDEDLPPLAPSTNPLFPNAIMKKPPNTHAKGSKYTSGSGAAQNVDIRDSSVSASEQGQGQGQGPIPVPVPVTAQLERSPAVPVTPKVLTGKNAPSTPHSLMTRGSARRSLASGDVDMTSVVGLRGEDNEHEHEHEVTRESVVVASEGEEEGDEKMEE
ncbi:hypothetical protein CI109_104299 [Kwoniella shandongensis]|uniref:Transcription factor CBF/NF-Y/archaeal histone domain-containing protein n=1 Tax=Kwoniella shandongensis TaxID=1734106 RepID=A0A5M6C4A5_9TREE|nr:uncharacterized protein CI109_002796 [Kwoniella shandongensis]KAA5528642.1 hypothetical protein CI109_002796 [Kwoniella shandongensis]